MMGNNSSTTRTRDRRVICRRKWCPSEDVGCELIEEDEYQRASSETQCDSRSGTRSLIGDCVKVDVVCPLSVGSERRESSR